SFPPLLPRLPTSPLFPYTTLFRSTRGPARRPASAAALLALLCLWDFQLVDGDRQFSAAALCVGRADSRLAGVASGISGQPRGSRPQRLAGASTGGRLKPYAASCTGTGGPCHPAALHRHHALHRR